MNMKKLIKMVWEPSNTENSMNILICNLIYLEFLFDRY